MSSRLLEGVMIDALLTLAAVIALLAVYGLAAPTWDGVQADTVAGGVFTLAAAGLAVLGVGWQIRAARRESGDRRAAELVGAKLNLIAATRDLIAALKRTNEILLSATPCPIPYQNFQFLEDAASSAHPIMANVARHASRREAAALHIAASALQRTSYMLRLLDHVDNETPVTDDDARIDALAWTAAAFALINGHFEYAHGERPEIVTDEERKGVIRFVDIEHQIGIRIANGDWSLSSDFPDARMARASTAALQCDICVLQKIHI